MNNRIRNEKGYGRIRNRALTLRLTESEYKSLEKLSKKSGKSKSDVIREMIRNG